MCGIAGLFFKGKFDTGIKNKFSDAVKVKQAHRGPDDYNEFQVTENIFFFHNRLSIIDVEHACQPMHDGKGVLTYNGEVYNFHDLRIPGESYRYNSDTEVLLKGLNCRSMDFLGSTRSMFGFGYFNYEKQQLTIARDRLGIKQVYYIDNEDYFAFASTITPLVMFSKKRLNVKALCRYYQNRAFPAPDTIFEDIKELPNASYLTFNVSSKKILSIKKWWSRQQLSECYANSETVIGNIESLLDEAVRDRMISDVPLGAYLSGGVDSSLIVALASKYNPDLNTFTVSMKEEKYDESPYAKMVCRHCNVKYNEIKVDAGFFINSIDSWIRMQDDIVADPSALMLFKVSELARDMGFKVMLSGEGSDELFGGYPAYERFKMSLELNKMLGVLKPFSGQIAGLFKGDSRKYNLVYNTLNEPRFLGTALIFEPELLKCMFKNYEEMTEFAHDLKSAMDMDIKKRIPDDILTRMDRATMAASIEARVPFMSHQLVDYTATLHPKHLININQKKYILKKVALRHIPKENVYRKKVGFDLPIEHWLRNEMKEQFYELMESSVQRDFINVKVIREIFDKHCSKAINAAGKLWAFASVELSFRYLNDLF